MEGRSLPPAVTLRRGVRGTVQAGRTPRRSSLFWRLVFAAAAVRGQPAATSFLIVSAD